MSDGGRPDPDALLSSLRREQPVGRRGRLKVFLGMCPGVGKTFAMLEAGRVEADAGRDVVVAYVETHGRPETDALAARLPQLPRRQFAYRGLTLGELDLDAVLARRPMLALVDELAHTNAPGARHPKRWQDVGELLEAGIDVFSTLNVQHVESLGDTVRQITGVEVRETVPDSVLDTAILELVDLPPAELLQRLREGKVYLPERAGEAALNFFREGNLTALRELLLRLVADHVGADTRVFRATRDTDEPWKTAHCLLVGVGPSPSSEPLIRWTRRMADGLRCRWLAVHVERARPLSPEAQARLVAHLDTARELGAEVVTTTGDDVVGGLLRIARQHNATQIVVGKPSGSGWIERWRNGRLLQRLARESGDIDVHVVRAEKVPGEGGRTRWRFSPLSGPREYLVATLVVGVTGLLNLGLTAVSGPRVPGLVFLLVVVLLALWLGRGPVLLAGALSALAWNFLFLPPRLTFAIATPEDAVLLAMYFLVAIALGQVVARTRAQELAERRREERAVALYEFMRNLTEAASRDEVVWQLVGQVDRVFRAPAAVVLSLPAGLVVHPDGTWALPDKELGVAGWAFRKGRTAGRFTENLPAAEGFHVPLVSTRKTFGVLVVKLQEHHLGAAQRDLLETFAQQAAMVLDHIELRTAAEQARLLAESERFSRTLLNSISHELRTPLAASTSAVSALGTAEAASPGVRAALLEEIQEANSRLNRIVGNLLDVARLESGGLRPRLDWHDARDVVQTSARELARELAGHPVSLDLPAEPLLVRMDFSLVQHAFGNLLLNAATHTPAGAPIEVKAGVAEDRLRLSVLDSGPGIAPEILPRIFDKFFRSPKAPAGGSGLGLTIAKGFVEAQGGTVEAENRPGGGARFTLVLPHKEGPPPMQSE